MLTNLFIKNFNIIENLHIELQSGMTVLTGETGSGKSIIIDTLELALGTRADNKVIRQGCERCEIIAIFDLKNIPAAKQWLKNHEFNNKENECIIRRIITIDGRSRNTINAIPSPQQLTRELGTLLINIHGQHEYQTILKRDKQRELLDDFANHKQLCDQVKQTYLSWQQANIKLKQLQELTKNHYAQSELLNYQIKELNEIALGENELENLHQEYKQLINAEQLLADCSTSLNIINTDNLVTAYNKLSNIKDINNKINSAYQLLNSAIIQTQEAGSELRHYLDNIDLNPERLQWVEQRLNTIHDLARKHHIKPEGLFELHKNLTAQLQKLNNAENDLKKTQQQADQLIYDYQNAANKLTASRKQAAQKLAQEITLQMQQLNMPQGKFAIRFSSIKDKNFTANGLEQVEFQVTANPGQPLQPINKVASGGELSRIGLAIQVITAQKSAMPTLIFDEVDIGIGGKTAEIVGQLLKTLGSKTQIICITHLPQVAVQGHQHIQVSKKTAQNTTIAQIKTLTGNARIEEIARMLGGIKITQQTLAHAKEMCAEF